MCRRIARVPERNEPDFSLGTVVSVDAVALWTVSESIILRRSNRLVRDRR